jgi:putative acetyltransferase
MRTMVRDATHSDDEAIRGVQRAAFANHPFSVHTEHLIVDQLRARGQLRLSLVGCDSDGTVVGHVAFSRVLVDGVDRRWFGLGPLAVLPEHQSQGCGSALIRQGLERLRRMGAAGCVVLGDPLYYARFDFAPCRSLLLPGVAPDHFMALALGNEPLPAGIVTYDDAFSVQP